MAHGRTHDDQIGLGDAFGQIDGGMGDGPHAAGDPQPDLPAVDAHDRAGQSRWRRAMPTDPPIRPTPTIATRLRCFIGQ